MKYRIIFFLSVLCVVSCKTKTDNTPRPAGLTYFNNKLNSWITYKVDSIVFSDFNSTNQKVDTFVYFAKETITEKFIGNDGKETNRIERSVRLNDTLPWLISTVWNSELTSDNLQKTEENIRYVKLVYPVKEGITWSGNRYNTLVPWDYIYSQVAQPTILNGVTFANTVTVSQLASDENLVQPRFAKEIYADGVGMIYKQLDTLEIQNNIKKGLYFRETAIDWSR